MNSKTYLALGDSYTIGEAVRQKESFPFQLALKLSASGTPCKEPDVLAVTGWTTGNLISAIPGAKLDSQYDLVSLLIGVNNQYQGLPPERFRKDFMELLKIASGLSKGANKQVLVLSIPDWGATPFGQKRDSGTISTEIDLFNQICSEESAKAGIRFIDITPISRRALSSPDLTESDDLHPSGAMYSLWTDKVLPVAKEILK